MQMFIIYYEPFLFALEGFLIWFLVRRHKQKQARRTKSEYVYMIEEQHKAGELLKELEEIRSPKKLSNDLEEML
jgi:hypothetical protein